MERGEQVQKSALVEIRNYEFFPKNINVKRGHKVSWINKDSFEHDIVSFSNEGFESGILHMNEIFTFDFNDEGEYEYYCGVHQEETGKVIVE